MNAIDELLKELDEHYNDPLSMVSAARTELAQLRADLAQALAERDAARAERDAAKQYQRMAARR